MTLCAPQYRHSSFGMFASTGLLGVLRPQRLSSVKKLGLQGSEVLH